MPCGHSPLKRPLPELLKYGVLNIDKTSNLSSHELCTRVKSILKVSKAGSLGTLNPMVTRCVVVFTENATRVVSLQQVAGKEYVAVLRLNLVVDSDSLERTVRFLTGKLYQSPPIISGVKRQLRVRHVYWSQLIEFDQEARLAIIRVACEAGTYIRTLCEHLGLVLGGGGAELAELRRTRTGPITQEKGMVTMHDVLDAKWLLDTAQDESYLRRVVRPVEWVLTNLKRIIIKGSAVDAICHGAPLLLPGVLRFSADIEAGNRVVIVTTKGEAVALGVSQMTSELILTAECGAVVNVKRVIMDRGTYKQAWTSGPVALEKKKLIRNGQLTKLGTPNSKTPANWLRDFLEGKLKNKI
jgi:H/ACA ribonucleoprotein complex subunit 4